MATVLPEEVLVARPAGARQGPSPWRFWVEGCTAHTFWARTERDSVWVSFNPACGSIAGLAWPGEGGAEEVVASRQVFWRSPAILPSWRLDRLCLSARYRYESLGTRGGVRGGFSVIAATKLRPTGRGKARWTAFWKDNAGFNVLVASWLGGFSPPPSSTIINHQQLSYEQGLNCSHSHPLPPRPRITTAT